MPKDPLVHNPFGEWIPEMLENVDKQQQALKPAPLVPEVAPVVDPAAAAAPAAAPAAVVPEVVVPAATPIVPGTVPPVVDPKAVDPKAVVPPTPVLAEDKPDASATGTSTGTDVKVTDSGNTIVPPAAK